MEIVTYMGIPGHVRLANGDAEVLVSTHYGPRVIRYALSGGDNVFAEIPPAEQSKPTPFGDDWHIYGGHRLWHAPEDPVRTYWPDNSPVVADGDGLWVQVTQPLEKSTRLEKQMTITLDPSGSGVTVRHRITNRGLFDVELAVWALSVMAKGGVGVFPREPFVPFPAGLLPVQPLVEWPYTRLDDARFVHGARYLRLIQDASRSDPQKIGMYSRQGWIAHLWRGMVFVKRYDPKPGPHADYGCNVETFTNDQFLEIETLSPLVRIAPGHHAEHVERWSLFTAQVGDTEDDIANTVEPLARSGAYPSEGDSPPP
ncbi:MAG: hypothetical protein U0441_22860 [Polyangiaceae bacterium]